MLSVGLASLFSTITLNSTTQPNMAAELEANLPSKRNMSSPAVNRRNRSASTSSVIYSYMSSPREALARYLFGFHAKTKRSLAEEAESGDEISVGSWIREGHNADELDAYGYTPLLNASAMGRLQAVNQLIKNGADLNKPGPFGFTPLHAAAQNGHREVVASLINAGARIDAQNQDMDTPMHLALRSNHIEIVYMLLRNGGNSKIQGLQSKDCVQCAKELGHKDLARTLKNYNPLAGYHPHSSPYVLSRAALAR